MPEMGIRQGRRNRFSQGEPSSKAFKMVNKVEFIQRYTRLIYCLPKLYAPYFYLIFIENTSVCMY